MQQAVVVTWAIFGVLLTLVGGINCAVCSNERLFSNQESPGGTLQENIYGLDICKEACHNNFLCHALDYNRVQNRCFLHFVNSSLSNTQYASDVDQYRYEYYECDENSPLQQSSSIVDGQQQLQPNVLVCEDTFIIRLNKHAGGGTDVGSGTVQSCTTSCLASPSCEGFDFVRPSFGSVNGRCWLHFDRFRLQPAALADTPEIDNYIRVPCAQECVDSFDVYLNQHAKGGTLVTNVNSLQQCQQVCRLDPFCLAVDVDAATCYMHSGGDLMRFPAQGVVHYVIRRCGVGDLHVVAPLKLEGIPPSECLDTYDTFEGKFSAGGIDFPSAISFEDCLRECRADTTCLAFDFAPINPGTKCFLHRNEGYKERFFDGFGVNQYRMHLTCVGGTPAPPTPFPPRGSGGCSMVPLENYAEVGGIPYEGEMSPSNCASRCLVDDSCSATDWNRETRICYRHGRNTKRFGNMCCIRYEQHCQSAPVLPLCEAYDVTLFINVATDLLNCDYMKAFARSLAYSLNLGAGRSHLSVITYDSSARVACDFNGGSTQGRFENCVLDIICTPTVTVDDSSAYNLYLNNLLNQQSMGDRLDRPNVVMVITGEKTTSNFQDLRSQIARLQQSNVKVGALGIQPDISEQDLSPMITEESLYRMTRSYLDLAYVDSNSFLRTMKMMGGCNGVVLPPGGGGGIDVRP